ncbi:MAG: flippase-like domain-containing protein [Bacteroidales bacterium]|nr:flippase-like domain-containing protein [Bacteroidales bacterium]MCF8352450.1 flippase-like domain-containing protein [Bacteroidales bacterium]MCF8375900.1 flippase-like domain-containing protein [Bacteroidales bacterium]
MKTKVNKTYNYLIRISIVLATYGFLYFHIFHKRNLLEVYQMFKTLIKQDFFVAGLILVFLVMLLNWAIETWKWKFLIKKIEHTKFFQAYQGVLTGISVSAFLPNRIGDYLGRVFILRKANHVEGILITMVGSISQLIVIIFIGSVALLIALPKYFSENSYYSELIYWGIFISVVVINFFIILFYFNISILSGFLLRFTRKSWQKLRKHLIAFSYFSRKELLTALALSALRYLVFSIQFYFLLRLFGVNIPFAEAFLLIFFFFFILTAIPTIALAEIGVRGSIGLFVFGLYFQKGEADMQMLDIGILSASSMLWLINIVIPAIAGTFFVFRLKFFRKNNKSV